MSSATPIASSLPSSITSFVAALDDDDEVDADDDDDDEEDVDTLIAVLIDIDGGVSEVLDVDAFLLPVGVPTKKKMFNTKSKKYKVIDIPRT